MEYAIACPHRDAALAGEDAFRSGGTAVDAALAAAAVLTVVYPHMCAIGGDAMALVSRPEGTVTALIGAGAAPASADPEAIDGDEMPWQGPDTVTVPGMVDAWGRIAELGATVPWADLLAPAIGFAREGAEIAPGLARALEAQPHMREHFPAGLRQPALAATLERIAENGPRELYEGITAQRLAEHAGTPLTSADLSRHTTDITEPLAARTEDFEILTAPRPTQGYVLHEILAALADGEEMADAFRRTAAERDRRLADDGRRSGDTVAIVAADGEGHAVSLIQSVYGAFGSGIVEPRTGILLHNRGAAFSLDPASPNRLAPGRRPAHTLMPVIARRGGVTEIVLGSMGGRAQPQINAQVMLRLLAGDGAAEAVAARRIVVEGKHIATEGDAVGHAQAIRRLPDGSFEAGSDPRADGVALTGFA